MFATTESDQIFPPLKDRLDLVDFAEYTDQNIRDLLAMYASETVFVDGVIHMVAERVRGNARSCVKMAENVGTYCSKVGRGVFGPDDWKKLCHALNILPYGITDSELNVLRELHRRGPCSLNMLASATGQSRSALQRDVEQYLLKKNFMKIDGKRIITSEGQAVLEQAEAE